MAQPIRHAVWLYARFTLSLRGIEEAKPTATKEIRPPLQKPKDQASRKPPKWIG
jgi:hypothetical protein